MGDGMVRMPTAATSIVDQLRDEFLADARDRLVQMQEAIELAFATGNAGGDTLVALRRQGHNLKGMGGGFGFPGISVVAHRMEDYLADLAQLSELQLRDAQKFTDALGNIVRGGFNVDGPSLTAMLRALPVKGGFDVKDVVQTDVEILLVVSSTVVRLLVERELRACGYRVVATRAPFEAFELAYRMKPDLILTSVVMDGFKGTDLVRALAAMEPTRNMPVALLTSLDAGHADLRAAPADVPIVRLGANFPEDFAHVVVRYQLS
ncbi:MAG: response regulator [Alphaproteobacteria bacterium]|nr:response regulator [Alphaproteobacteria bacterium]